MIDEGTEKALQATPVRWTVQKDGLVSEDSLVVSTTSEYASQRGQRDWEALEKNSFDFLFSRAEAILEMKALPGDVRANCLSLAKRKVLHLQQLDKAVETESKQEEKRQVLCTVCTLTSLKTKQEEERRAAREYIRQLQHDNEIILLKEMAAAGLLW